MMNRAAGIGSLMRAGPAPGRAGLSHLARGEAVIPNAAMNADPSLRQRAMMAMASRGRNPSQFTVGQRNLRNPSTGMPMFADLVYVDGQYVDASTGQPASFSGGSYADTGYVGPAPGTPKQFGTVMPYVDETYVPPTGPKAWGDVEPSPVMPTGPKEWGTVDATPVTPTGPKSWGSTSAVEEAPTYVPLPSPEAPPPSLDFSAFTAPQTYEQWQQTRNPSGKNVPNTLFGQTQTAGGNAGFSTGGMEMPNVLAGQMPVAGASWGTPGTALGFGRENTANDPSILRSGYNDLSLSPSIYSAAFGANGLMGQQSGIAFSGQNPMTGGQNGQQNQYGTPYGAFNTAFRY
jgi:hypothetical protein